MDIQFFNSGDHAPKPREEIKIERVNIAPYPDRQRVHVEVSVTPFRERPNLILMIHDDEDNIVSELNIIETMHYTMEFTMHLRNHTPTDDAYTLTVELFYESRNPPQDQYIDGFTLPGPNSQESE